MASGYLVVLKAVVHSADRLYRGVDRVPAYDLDSPERNAGLEEYVLGEIKDKDTNLIASRRDAIRLQQSLNSTKREFEVIYCRSGDDLAVSDLATQYSECLGYDIAAVRSDYWSIVDDFSIEKWAEHYRNRLNEHGLFAQRKDAESYLHAYRAHGGPDADAPFDVIEVSLVRQIRTTPS